MFQNATFKRWFFISVSVIILSLVFWNTYAFFNQLKENERIKMEIWTEAQREFANADINIGSLNPIYTKILNSNTTTPMINFSHIDSTYTTRNIEEQLINTDSKLEKMMATFESENAPITSKYKNKKQSTLYYGNSPLINKLKYYPVVLLIIIGLFISTLYYIYETSRSAEQNRLWAGMAKETAHQIGTPLSSLIGWNEILKTENVNPEYLDEMKKDIDRLETIADRFSKVGSVPDLEPIDIIAETISSFEYLKSRTSKLIHFSLDSPQEKVIVNLNKQLYSWTIENLVKNGIDAMRGKGDIHVEIIPKQKNIHIKVSDTGKGIPKKNFKQIFKPGYTTKKRGWGLGLSLAKRIIEEYHGGKIRVCHSTLEEGTTMEIIMKRSPTAKK